MSDREASDRDRRSRLDRARELRLSGRLDECSRVLQELLTTDPMDFEAIAEGGFLALDNGDFASAEQVLLACRQFLPRAPELLEGAGEAAYRAREMDRAVAHLRAAVTQAPSRLGARLSLGQMLCAVGCAGTGLRELHRCLREPAAMGSEDGFRQSLMRIALGKGNGGWREYASHWEAANQRFMPATRWWRGEACPDNDLYLLSSGGLGDTLLLARFIPDAVRRARRVILGVPPVLARLMAPLGAITDWSGVYADIPSDARVASLWHLPWLLDATPRDVASRIPYLEPPADHPRIEKGAEPLVGIAWAGARGVSHNADRSPPSLSALSPVFEIEGVSWMGLHPEQVAKDECSALGISAMPAVRDLADTAGIVSQLDLVITVDSAMANLAGALGVPVWVMPTTVPELRWPPGALQSPWYPHARLFRRRVSRDWERVATDLSDALRASLKGTTTRDRFGAPAR